MTFSIPGKFFYIQEGLNAVRVQTNSMISLKPGDRVEAAGFVEISGLNGTLSDATVRKIGVGVLPKPLAISPVEILALYDATSAARPDRPSDWKWTTTDGVLLPGPAGGRSKATSALWA